MNDCQINDIGFINNLSIFADTLEGMQNLLNVVQEFRAWCGRQINVKKKCLLVIDCEKKRREQEPAPLLTIDGETLQAIACRYLGYLGTGNGVMRATKEVVRQKIIAARDLIKCHPLTPGYDMCNIERRAKSSGVDSCSAKTVTETKTAYATVL